ncbi:hypothetical protein [Rickettsiella massiliensis]|uniref:hypothetical protein n=1 Tax=Rickettsiella massiliensis TaxID=676517 RepID=UPI00029A6589|nr:hypothetical protein [Rickettsiella massiliensis]
MESFANLNEPLRIGLVVGEPSGDLLAANLLNVLHKRGIHFTVEGILGPRTQKSQWSEWTELVSDGNTLGNGDW